MERLHVVVQGRVQGVYFRASAQNKARLLGLRGWVRNCADGSVEFVAEGERSELEQLLSWSQAGPLVLIVVSTKMSSAGLIPIVP